MTGLYGKNKTVAQTHTGKLVGTHFKRRGERQSVLRHWSCYLSSLKPLSSCKTEEEGKKNQSPMEEVQGAVKSIIFYFQISFRHIYTLSEKSGPARGQRPGWKW